MSRDLSSALCLVLVLEGVLLFAAPRAWQRMAERMREVEPHQLRLIGGVLIGVGIAALQFVR